MNALSFLILATLAAGVLMLPRNWAAVCLVVGTLYLTQGAAIDLAGFSFFPARLLGYLCLARVLSRGEFSFSRLTRADKALLLLYGFVTLILLTRPEESAAMRLAKLLDTISVYAAFRAFVRTPEEFRWLLGVLALLLVPYVLLLAVESFARQNLFSWVGAASAGGPTWERDGRPRCFGSFRHPSLLGSLGACFLPLFVALAWEPSRRRVAILGAVLCVAIVGFSNSGGPISVLAMAVVGWLLWPIRTRMQQFRRGLLALLVLLALFMKAPIWYLPARVSSITGGTGWHRSYLMDVAFRHFDEWWLVGMPIVETKGWFPYTLAATGGADITNQFIAFGLSAGIVGIFLFLLLIVRAFSFVGQALARVRERAGPAADEALLWGLGVALAAHISNWLGITYFDQFSVLWLLQLAALVSLSEHVLQQPVGEASAEPAAGDGLADGTPPAPDWFAGRPVASPASGWAQPGRHEP